MKRNIVKKIALAGILIATAALQACVVGPAALPQVGDITPTEPHGYDGVWMISGINKRLQFEGGRAVVLDPWIHWGFGVEKGMVALINLRTTDNGEILGDDLVNAGSAWRGFINADGRIDVTVETSPLPIKYQLIPVQLDYPDYVQQLTAVSGSLAVSTPVAAPVPVDNSDYAPEQDNGLTECVNLVVDPQTNQQVCLD